MPKIFLKTICFSLLLLAFMISNALAKVPDSVLKKKNAVVTVFVDDRNKRHVESGSGFIVDQDGVIVTNCRVIARWIKEIGSTLHVETDGGVSFPLEELISSKCENNLALFRIKANDLPAVKLAKDYNPRPGEKIAIIKKPLESEAAVSEGIVQGIMKRINPFRCLCGWFS
jgi:S1-C subfamily serine protease